MKSSALMALMSAIFLALLAMPANAQTASFTFVSGVGADANPCSSTQPCLTFAGAIAKTAAGGTVACLDSGNFGAVTIAQSITIDCEEGTGTVGTSGGAPIAGSEGAMGSITASGTDAIDVTRSGIVVNLRGLDIEGAGTGLIGINVTQAATVYIKKSVIYGFQGGRASGMRFSGGGTLVVDDTVVHSNGTGIVLDGSGGSITMTLRNVIVHSNSADGISIITSGSSASATIDHSTLAFNGGTGLIVNGGAASAIIGNSTITGNSTGVSAPLGKLYSFKNNQIGGNITDGTPIAGYAGPTAKHDFTATPTSGHAPLAVTFRASGLNLPMTYTVNFGDGTMGPFAQGSCFGAPPAGGEGGTQCSGSATHTYTNTGTDTATLLNASGNILGAVTITVGRSVIRPDVGFAATPPQASPPVTTPPPIASGGTTPYGYSDSAGTLPVGTNLNTSTGTVSGTPTTAGAFSDTIEATDSESTPQMATQVLSGTIASATLTLTATPSSTTQFGKTYSQTNVAGGGTMPYAYSVSAGTLPAGTELNISTGAVSGTPTTPGAFSYTIKATNSGGPAQTATQVVTGTISE
jgi:hypothetical protein